MRRPFTIVHTDGITPRQWWTEHRFESAASRALELMADAQAAGKVQHVEVFDADGVCLLGVDSGGNLWSHRREPLTCGDPGHDYTDHLREVSRPVGA